ncbi:MAG: hypothetical protein HFF50_04025 [Lawsonibacter sp.]|nr:hypothetical protein [Lawsonibacter sp.]
MDLLRGQRESIRRLCGGLTLDLELFHRAPVDIDVSCFGLDAAGKLSDERYFVFYNQTKSPEGAITLEPGPASGSVRFHLQLDRLPTQITKLAFTAAIDGTRTLQELEKGYARLLDGQRETGRFSYTRADFGAERAIVVCEIYRKGDDWRFNAVGRGFNGGLKALVESFGGVVAAAPKPAPPSPARPANPAPARPSSPSRPGLFRPGRPGPTAVQNIVSVLPPQVCARMDNLARQCRGDTEYLSPLFKNMFSALAAFPEVAKVPIQTVLCADASGSMFDMYRNGRIQRAVDKAFAFAATLTDSASMDAWAFGAKSRQFGAVTMDNVRDYTFAEAGGFERWMSMLNYQINNEPEAMRDITMIYGGQHRPVLVLFLTDGRLSSDWAIEEILIKTSRLPLYWQFIGLHGEEYGILEHLDEIDGRRSDNAAFLKADDIDDLSDLALFNALLANLNGWLASCKDLME